MGKRALLAINNPETTKIFLVSADEGNGGAGAATAAQQLLAQGAEVIVGPLFGPSVSAVAPIARDRAVPVPAFSTEKTVAGNTAYILSFIPPDEMGREDSYAAPKGPKEVSALAPASPLSQHAQKAFP